MALWVALALHCGTLGFHFDTHGVQLGGFGHLGHFGQTLGLHFGALGLHLGTLGVHVGVLWALWGVALDPSGHFCEKCLKKAPAMDAKIKTLLMIF